MRCGRPSFHTETLLQGGVWRTVPCGYCFGIGPVPNFWDAAIEAKIEETKFPLFQKEWAAMKAAKKESRKALNKIVRVFPSCDWLKVSPSVLGFKSQIQLREEAAVEKIATDKRKAAQAAFLSRDWIWIAGVKAPKMNGSWAIYTRLSEEPKKTWARRVRSIKRSVMEHRQSMAEEYYWQLPALERLERGCRAEGGLYNRFTQLYHVSLDRTDTIEEEVPSKPLRIRGPKRRFIGPLEFIEGRASAFIEQCLARKLKLFYLQDEWKEARFLRREKMSRVVIFNSQTHSVEFLRSKLEDLLSSYSKRTAQHEMEVEGASAQGKAGAKSEKTSTVVMQKQTGSSVASSLPSKPKTNAFQQFSASESKVDDSTFHDRWFTFHSFQWTTSNARGARILSLDLPRDIFNNTAFRDSPNYAIFSRHMFWKGDIEIKIKTNTNVRQYGQLQFSFYYGHHQDVNYLNLRSNIYTCSQRLHALLTANFNNEVVMKIPFEYIFPKMAINKVPGLEGKSLGHLLGLVIVPLTTIQACSPSCTVKVLVRFLRNEFSGMVGLSLAHAEMLPAFATIVAIREIMDKNRDNPTLISPGVPVIPVNSSSWCYGTGQSSFNNVLRLNPNSMLPYPEGRIPDIDEMTIDYIKRIFGMIYVSKWSKDDGQGKQLLKFNATPLDSLDSYPSFEFEKENVFSIPPIGILTSMFAYWRGSMELRIDLVGATELSGSLLIAYIPRYSENDNVTMDQAFACPHSIFDIHENRQIVFKIPYVASHMFWPRRQTLSEDFPIYPAPGCVYIFVYNQLVYNCTVPGELHMIYYLRGGEDFELSVPSCPSLALSFNPKIYLPATVSQRVIPITGYVPVYSGSWRGAYFTLQDREADKSQYLFSKLNVNYSFNTGANIGFPILRYGPVSDHICQLQTIGFSLPFRSGDIVSKIIICEVKSKNENMKFGVTDYSSPTLRVFDCTHLIIWNTGGYNYAIPITSTMATLAAHIMPIKELHDSSNSAAYLFALIFYVQIGVNPYGKSGALITTYDSEKYWEPDFFYAVPLGKVPTSEGDDGDDERSDVKAEIASPQDSARASASKVIFGEQFLDLKDFCRRYQLYASASLKIEKLLSTANWRSLTIRFPVLPHGLDLDLGLPSNPKEYWNRTRDGPIPLIASGFRFFTGGIRYRICINVKDRSNLGKADLKGKIYVQHRPNVISKFRKVVVQSTVNLGSDDIELPGYAAYHQFEDLNNVISVEIPFYMPSIRTYLQRPSGSDLAERFTNLGEIAVGVTVYSYNDIVFDYDIYYSLADDARFSAFIGFPPVIDIAKIPPLEPVVSSNEEEELEVSDEDIFKAKLNNIVRSFPKLTTQLIKISDYVDKSKNYSLGMVKLNALEKKLNPQHEMFSMFNKASKAAETIEKLGDSKAIENVEEIAENVKSITERIKDNLSNIIPSFETISEKTSKYVNLAVMVVSQLIQAILNFNLRSIVVAIGAILVQIKLTSFSMIDTIVSKLSKVMETLLRNKESSSTELIPEVLTAQHEADDIIEKIEDSKQKVVCGYISSLVAGIASLFAIVPKACGAKSKELGYILLDGINKFSMTANNLFTFIKNNLCVVKHIGEWLFSNHPSLSKLGFLKDKNESIYEWAKLVHKYTDPRFENEIFTNLVKSSQVYTLAAQGCALQIKMMELELKSAETTILNILIKKILDLRDRLAKTHSAPPVRFVPFVYELTGPTGVGKSELFNDIPYIIFKHMKFQHTGELNYYRALGNQYWNGLRNQPVCTIDEKFPIDTPEFLGVQLAELFQLKSSCVFNPPMADIPDKNIRYNPLLVQYGSNVAFPNINCFLDKEAVFRRRDLLIKVDLNDSLKTIGKRKYEDLTINERGVQGRYSFLKFWVHKNPVDCNEGTENWKAPMNFDEFKVFIAEKFEKYYLKELSRFTHKMSLLNSLSYETGESVKDIFKFDWFDKLNEEEVDVADRRDKIPEIRNQYNFINSTKVSYELYCHKLCLMMCELKGDMARAEYYAGKILKLQRDEIGKQTNSLIETPVDIAQAPTPPNIAILRPNSTPISQMGEEYCIHEGIQNYWAAHQTWGFAFERGLFQGLGGFRASLNSKLFNEFVSLYHAPSKDVNALLMFNEIFSTLIRDAHVIINYHTELDKYEILVKYTSCKETCPLYEKDDRLMWLKTTWCNTVYMRGRLANGKLLEPDLPDEYLVTIKDYQASRAEHIQIEEKLPLLKGWWKTLTEKFYNIEWVKWLKRLGIVIAIVSFIGAIFGCWEWASADNSKNFVVGATGLSLGATAFEKCSIAQAVQEGHVSGDMIVSKQPKKSTVAAAKALIGITPHSQMGLKNIDALKNNLRRNMFYLCVQDSVKYSVGRCLGIAGNWAIFPYHYWESWQHLINITGEEEISFFNSIDGKLSAIKLNFKDIKMHRFENSGLAMLHLPKRVPLFRNIRNFILPRSAHSNLNGLGTIHEQVLTKAYVEFETKDLKFCPFQDVKVGDTGVFTSYKIHEGYEYDGFSGKGRCGSILTAHGVEAPIVGMHVAGYENTNFGMSELIYREMFDFIDAPDIHCPKFEGVESSWFVDGECFGIGKVPAAFAHHERGRSKVVPSELQLAKDDRFLIRSAPVVLSRQDPRINGAFSPLIEGVRHHANPTKPFPENSMLIAIEDYKQLILANCPPERRPSLLSLDIAIGGIEGKQGYEHLEFNTSEGFPFVGMRPKGSCNKRWLFDFNEDNKYIGISPILASVLKLKENQRLNNVVPVTVFTDCLKDTILPREKVLLPGKTRVFSMAPVDFTIQQRQCTLDFVVAFMKNRLNLEHMIGCNPDSLEWTHLTRRLLKIGNNIATGDYSKFGDNIPVEFVQAAFEIISAWYRFHGCEDNNLHQQLKIMAIECSQSYHLMFDHVYQVVCGQPSGNSLTVIINSIANSLYLRVAWLEIMKNSEFCSLTDFVKYVKIYSYGDDIIISLHDIIKDKFNAKFLSDFFAKFNLKFTNADKSDLIIPYDVLENADFLKRGFVVHPNRKLPTIILAPLCVESIEETPNWVWEESFGRSEEGSFTFREMSVQVTEDSIRNAFGRGPMYYSTWSSKLVNFWLKKGIKLKFDTWEQMDNKIFNLNMNLSQYSKITFSNITI